MGRKRGISNKLSMSVKETIEQVAKNLGGTRGLEKWANKDPANARIFWGNIYPKLLPLQANVDVNGKIEISVMKFNEYLPVQHAELITDESVNGAETENVTDGEQQDGPATT